MRTAEAARVCHLLLVEDNAADAGLMSSLFEIEKFHGVLHWVKNGEEALDFIFRRGAYCSAPRPDLVLLDLTLPRVHGRDVLRAMRDDVTLAPIPVIVLTSSSSQTDMLSLYRMRACGFLTKPRELVDYEKLVRRILHIDLPLAIRMG